MSTKQNRMGKQSQIAKALAALYMKRDAIDAAIADLIAVNQEKKKAAPRKPVAVEKAG